MYNKLKPYLSKFRSLKSGYYLIIATAFLTFFASFYLIIEYITEKTSEVSNVRVTNVTGTSASVSWITKDKVKGSVIYSSEDKWNPILPHIGKARTYDDRDVDETSYGKYKLEKWNDYYIHHVTLKDLEPNTRYYFRISTGFKVQYGRQYDPIIDTTEILDVRSPENMYGAIKGDGGGRLEQDALVYMTVYFENHETGYIEESARFSQVTTNGSYSFDVHSIRAKYGDKYFIEGGEKYYESIQAIAHGYDMSTMQVDSDKHQPAKTIILEKDNNQKEADSLRSTLAGSVYAEETSNVNCNHPNDTGLERARYYDCCACNKAREVVKCEGEDGYDQFHWSSCKYDDAANCSHLCPAEEGDDDEDNGPSCANGTCSNPGATLDWCESRECDENDNSVCKEKYCDIDGCIQYKPGRYDSCANGCENGTCKDGEVDGGSGGTCAGQSAAPGDYVCKTDGSCVLLGAPTSAGGNCTEETITADDSRYTNCSSCGSSGEPAEEEVPEEGDVACAATPADSPYEYTEGDETYKFDLPDGAENQTIWQADTNNEVEYEFNCTVDSEENGEWIINERSQRRHLTPDEVECSTYCQRIGSKGQNT